MDLPFQLFGSDPTWVPPLRSAVYDRLSSHHPALTHQEVRLWLARRDGRPVARLGACVDSMFNEFQDESWAWVGFFESADDQEAAQSLFSRAWEWAADKGVKTCVGPASFTTNDECGLLIEGFEQPAYIFTAQNPPYYERLWVQSGWEQAMDLYGWTALRPGVDLSERQRSVLKRIAERGKLTVRGVRMDRFDEEVSLFFELYSSAWARNWGFAPMTEAEVRHIARDMKRLIDPEVALFVEREGVPIAACLCLPDANEPMAKVRSGRLLPFGWYHLLRGLKRPNRYRVFALGVRPEYQNLAVGPLLYGEIIGRLKAKPEVETSEASWILANNERMNNAIEAVGGYRHKTWRMYQRPLS